MAQAAVAARHHKITKWDEVDTETDNKFFNVVEGEAEENRAIKKNEAECIAAGDFSSAIIYDPITQRPIEDLNHIIEKEKVSIDQIYISLQSFDP
jgi:hypothetical protein